MPSRRLRSLRGLAVAALAAALALPACRARQAAPAGQPPLLKFGLVTDVHSADIETRGARTYRESLAKLGRAVEAWNAEKVDFALEIGDFKDQADPPAEASTLDYLRRAEAVFAGFRGPRFHALGNHDVDSLTKEQFLAEAPNSGIAPGRSFYAFEAKGVRFIVLDACFEADGTPYARGAYAWEDANVPPAEIAWLEGELAASALPAVVFIHHQLDGEGAYDVKNAAEVRRALEASGKVLAVFQGHRHEGDYRRLNGIHYYTLKGLIEGPGAGSATFAVVEMNARRDLKVRGFGAADGLTLLAGSETKAERDARMAWWREARFGLFIHWGLYAVPAGEWEGKTTYGEWIRNNARIPIDVYDGFVARFNPVRFDARAWVRAAKDAGMRYIVITSKHHDGFALFDSKVSTFDVMATPFGRDVLKELAEACRAEGLRLGFYHSIMDWHHPDYLPRRDWEAASRTATGADFDRYVAYMKAQLKELLTGYGDIGVLWFDGEWENTWNEARGRDLYDYVRALKPDIIVNNRVGASRSGMAGFSEDAASAGDFGTPEQQVPATGLPGVDWETCLTMNDNWGYNKADKAFKSARDLIRTLVDIASKGGNLLLNVGPTAEGVFPPESVERLAEIGRWMKANGESIYGTQAAPFRSLPWGRATRKDIEGGVRLYLHVFEPPRSGEIVLPGLLNEPRRAYRLADPRKAALTVARREDALVIGLPGLAPDAADTVVVLDLAGPLDVADPPEIAAGQDIFTDALDVSFRSAQPGVEIRYTLDGSVPGPEAPPARGSVRLTDSAIVSARAFRDGKPVSGASRAEFRKVSPLPAVDPGPVESGLAFAYYEGEWDAVAAMLAAEPVSRGKVPGFRLAPRRTRERSGFVYTGYVKVPLPGVYTFFLASDDGSRLSIGRTVVVDNDGLHGMQEKRGLVALAAGLHPIRVEYFNKTGGDGLTVSYQGQGIGKKPIPEDALKRAR